MILGKLPSAVALAFIEQYPAAAHYSWSGCYMRRVQGPPELQPAFNEWSKRYADRPHYAPVLDYFKDRCVAVTSLSPNPERHARQQHCLRSWANAGLPIIAVNEPADISQFNFDIHGLTHYASDAVTDAYDRKTMRVTALIEAGRSTGVPFLLLNSDIEISGPSVVLDMAIKQADRLTIGIRMNHDPCQPLQYAVPEPAGLDCFLMTPEMAATIKPMPFGIGKPVWDYWLPHHFRSQGFKFNWIREPFFFHASHKLCWTTEEWLQGAAWLQEYYGLNLVYTSLQYRKSLI